MTQPAPEGEQKTKEEEPSKVLLEAEEKSDKRYKREVWWVENRPLLKKIGIWAIVVVEVVVGIIGIWAFVDYFLIDYVEEQRLVESFFVGTDNLSAVVLEQVPQNLSVSDARVVSSSGTYDIVSFVENPNEGHVAQITYRFEYSGDSSEQETVVVLQDESQPLVLFNLAERPRSAQIVVDDVRWWRVDRHSVPDPMAWKDARLNFEISDLNHSNDVTIGDRTVGRTTMKLHNKSGFGYYEIDLYIALKRGGTVVGINRTSLSSLMPNEERMVQVDWFDKTTSPSSIEVYTVVNLFDESVYMPEDVDPELDRRDTRERR